MVGVAGLEPARRPIKSRMLYQISFTPIKLRAFLQHAQVPRIIFYVRRAHLTI